MAASVVPALSGHSSFSINLLALNSKPSIQIAQQQQQQSPPTSISPLSSFTGHGSRMVSENLLTVAAVAEAVTLTTAAAAQAAKDAVSSAQAFGEITPMHARIELNTEGQSDGSSTCSSDERNVLVGNGRRWRRARRRKWRKYSEQLNDDDDDDAGSSSHRYFTGQQCLSRSACLGYLTPREEAEFSFYLKEGARLEAERKKFHKASKDDDPSGFKWPETAVGIKMGNVDRVFLRARECRERITLSYKRLVSSIAIPYEGKGLSLEDLIQEGCIGLLRGAERFDSKRGYKLSTYVYWWIKQAIIKAIAKKSRIVRLPGYMSGAAAKVAEANTLLRRRLGRWPTYDEIADFVDTSVSRVQLVCERSRHPISADRPVTKDGMTLKDIVPGPEETRPEAMVTKKLITLELENLLRTLTVREEYILRLHYGLNGETAQSCEDIGRLLNLSRERVRQIHWAALRKLQEKKSLIEGLVKSVV